MSDARAKQANSTESKADQAAATDEETLSEIEEKAKLSDTPKSYSDQSPKPDANPDERRNERDDAGPM